MFSRQKKVEEKDAEKNAEKDGVEEKVVWGGPGPAPKPCKLRLGIHFAEGIMAADHAGTSDPLVKVFWQHKLVYTTDVKHFTLNPRWEESFDVPLEYEDDLKYCQLRCEIWDRDTIGKDDFLGRVVLRGYNLVKRFGHSTYVEVMGMGAHPFKLKRRLKGDEKLNISGVLHLSFALIDQFEELAGMDTILGVVGADVDADASTAGSEYLRTLNWVVAAGRADLAEKVALSVIRKTCAETGDDSEHASSIRDIIGNQFKKCGKYQVSFEHHDRALLSRLRAFDDEGVGDSYHYLGTLAAARGERDKAEDLFVKAISFRKKVHGERSAKVAVSLNQLAELYKGAGKFDQAKPAAGEAYGMMCDIYGEKSVAAANVLKTLAAVLRRIGKPEEALEMTVDILSTQDEQLGPHHPATTVSLANLAASYRSLAKHDHHFHDEGMLLAQNSLRRCLTVKEHLYGKESLKLCTTLVNFAKLYSETMSFDRAEPVMRRAYIIRKKMLGNDHGDTIITKSCLANIVSHRGRVHEAKTMLLECLDSVVKRYGQDHPFTDKVFRNYVFTATEEGVRELQIAFGESKHELEEVPPFRYVWERAYDWIKSKLGLCMASIIERVKRKKNTTTVKDVVQHDDEEESEENKDHLFLGDDGIDPDGDEFDQQTEPCKPDRKLGQTKLFDRPVRGQTLVQAGGSGT